MIKVENLEKHFGTKRAVAGVTFSVERGEILGFLGPNGAGKSTTMRLITQYYEPDTGEIRLDGVPLAAAARATASRRSRPPTAPRSPRSSSRCKQREGDLKNPAAGD